MRQFRSSRLPRLAPAALAGLAAAALLAGAPSPARAESVPTTYVIPFGDQSRSGNPDLARQATQRLSEALQKYGARAVVPEGRVHEAARDLKFRAPYDQHERLLLAAKLDAHQVIYGSVSSVRFEPGPEAQGHVRMMVVIETPLPAGSEMQALLVEGSSPIRKEADQQALLSEALDHASAQVASLLQVNATIGAPFRIASAVGTPPAGTPPPVAPTGVTPAPVVNGTVDELGARVPPPVVVDAPGIDRDLGTARRNRIISTRTVRTLVGGILLLGLLGLATGGPLGALGP